MTETESFPYASCLVMAASRRGVDDPVAKIQGLSHKCLVEIDGQVMLERVLEALVDSSCFNTIHVSVDHIDILTATPRMAGWVDEGRVVFVQAHGNLADSVLKALDHIPEALPLVITTGDNALHTPEIIRDFVRDAHASQADAVVGMTRESVVLREYANSGLAFHRLKDDGFSSCNLYALKTPNATKAVQIFEGGGQFGKRHMRILKAFGLWPFVIYKLKLKDFDGLLASISKRLKVKVDTSWLEYPWGPIDVDHEHSFNLTEATLIKRRESAEG
ncbi:MAG: nucleotidyltransferase family protein [Erythrobacter sp.]|nr:nucleotidyltransferase family protein [Erythrobacter sp.]